MSEHLNIIKWYIKREEAAHAKNEMHKKNFLEILRRDPYIHKKGIENSLTRDVLNAGLEIGAIDQKDLENLPWKVVYAFKQHFLYENKINLDYT